MTKQHQRHNRGSHLTTNPANPPITIWQLIACTLTLACFVACIAAAFGIAYAIIATLGANSGYH